MKNNRSLVGPGCFAALIVALAVAGCASTTPAPVTQGRSGASPRPTVAAAPAAGTTYTVKRGDTLYSIAREHGIDYRELIALNNIENPGRVAEGVVLRIRPANETNGAASAVATTSPITTDVVVSRPINGEPVIESRPLTANAVPPTTSPAAAPAPASTANSELLKREPKGGKEPYSEQAMARAQGVPKTPEAAVPAPAPAAAATPKTDEAPEPRSAEAPPTGADEVDWIWPAKGRTIATFSEAGSKGVDIAGRAGDPVIAAGDGKVVYSGTGLRGYGKLVIIKHNNTYLSAYAHNQAILVKEGQSVSKGQKIAEMGNSDTDQVKLHFEVRRQGKPVDPLRYLPQR